MFSSNPRNKILQYYDEQNKLFDQPVKNLLRTYDNVRKIATGQGYDYRTESLLDYPYFKKYYKLILIDLTKQKK